MKVQLAISLGLVSRVISHSFIIQQIYIKCLLCVWCRGVAGSGADCSLYLWDWLPVWWDETNGRQAEKWPQNYRSVSKTVFPVRNVDLTLVGLAAPPSCSMKYPSQDTCPSQFVHCEVRHHWMCASLSKIHIVVCLYPLLLHTKTPVFCY